MKSNYPVEFRRIPRQSEFHVFRGTGCRVTHGVMPHGMTMWMPHGMTMWMPHGTLGDGHMAKMSHVV